MSIPLSRSALFLGALLLLAVGVRVVPVWYGELWGDEMFSLAMATGHSLEHPAAVAEPGLGDYLEPAPPQDRRYFSRYVAHEEPPAGVWRVVRAVRLSDTNPPVYYLLLNVWTRAVGTSDAALRSFSMLWAILTIPLLWLVTKEVGGPTTAWIATVLFTVSPVSIYYSAEGRMYSLLWFLSALLAWLSLALARRGPRAPLLIGWVVTGATGLLVHYFFAFVWAAGAGWLLLNPGRLPRAWAALLDALTALVVLPWFLNVRESLRLWRVTAGWLDGPLSGWQALTAPFSLGWNLLTWRYIMSTPGPGWDEIVGAVAYTALALLLARRGWRHLFSERCSLIWFWMIGACVGPVVFDLLLGTHTAEVPRYALAGFPAAMLLVGAGLTQVNVFSRAMVIALIVASWIPGIAVTHAPRPWVVYRTVAASLDGWAGPSNLVIVHSIPSGVIGVSRYLRSSVPIASWVVQLATRSVPQDLEALLRGRHRVALVKTHDLGKPNPAEPWLREHALLEREEKLGGGSVLYFAPKRGGTILPENPNP